MNIFISNNLVSSTTATAAISMSAAIKTDIFILYGSQTGNAEFIAKELHGKCQENEIPAQVMTLNDASSITLKDIAKVVLIICSTTGNGDAPENADGWWRKVKLRSVVCII